MNYISGDIIDPKDYWKVSKRQITIYSAKVLTLAQMGAFIPTIIRTIIPPITYILKHLGLKKCNRDHNIHECIITLSYFRYWRGQKNCMLFMNSTKLCTENLLLNSLG